MTPLNRILVGLCGAFAGVAALYAIAPETTRPYLQSLKGDPCFLLSDDEADAADVPIQFAFGSY